MLKIRIEKVKGTGTDGYGRTLPEFIPIIEDDGAEIWRGRSQDKIEHARGNAQNKLSDIKSRRAR